MDDKELALIDRYLSGDLTPEERRMADVRRQSDPEFDQMVRDMEQAVEALRVYRREELRKQFVAIDARLDGDATGTAAKKTRRPPWLWIVIAAAAAVAALLWWGDRLPVPPHAPDQPPAETIDTMPQDPTTPDIAQPEPESVETPRPAPESPTPTEKPKDWKTPDGPALFAEYFEPYKDMSMEPGDRSADEPEGSFEAMYWTGRYTDAIEAYAGLPKEIAVRETVRFRYANALMTLGRAEEARPFLLRMVEAPATTYGYEARYLLALADLQRGDLVSAHEHLRIYRDQKIAVRRDRAEALLARLAE
jgi:hypothetical protein